MIHFFKQFNQPFTMSKTGMKFLSITESYFYTFKGLVTKTKIKAKKKIREKLLK